MKVGSRAREAWDGTVGEKRGWGRSWGERLPGLKEGMPGRWTVVVNFLLGFGNVGCTEIPLVRIYKLPKFKRGHIFLCHNYPYKFKFSKEYINNCR